MKGQKVTQKDLAFGKRLKRLRGNAELTQEGLSYKTKLSVTFLALLEKGKRRPSIKSLQKIASALKLRVKDLINF